jgi:hypothetical protein
LIPPRSKAERKRKHKEKPKRRTDPLVVLEKSGDEGEGLQAEKAEEDPSYEGTGANGSNSFSLEGARASTVDEDDALGVQGSLPSAEKMSRRKRKRLERAKVPIDTAH